MPPKPSKPCFHSYEDPDVVALTKLLGDWDNPAITTAIRAPRGGADGETYAPEKQLADYLAKRETKGVPVYYRHSALSGGCGRRFPVGGCGLTSFARPIRHTLAAGRYYDIDIKNAHPTFAVQYGARHGICVGAIASYNDHRDACLRELMELNGMSKDAAKVVCLALLNGGTSDYRALCEVRRQPEWLERYAAEVGALHDAVMRMAANEPLIKRLRRAKGDSYPNLRGSVFNHVLCGIEDDCLMAAVAEAERQGVRRDRIVLAFDGLMIPTSSGWTPTAANLQALSDAVHKATDYRVEFADKPMDEGLDLSLLRDPPGRVLPPAERVVGDEDAANRILERLRAGGLAKWCHDRLYVRVANTWTDAPTVVDRFLTTYIARANLVKQGRREDDDGVPFSSETRNVRTIKEQVRAFAAEMLDDPLFGELLHTSNLRKICFRNGVYDLPSATFTRWEDLTEPVYSAVQVPWDWVAADEAIEARIGELMERVVLPIFGNGEKAENILQCTARGMAGEVTDKQFMVMLGERDCGKGVFTEALSLALGGEGVYCATTSMENLMLVRDRGGGDAARNQAWMIAGRYARFLLMNEVTMEETNPHQRINGDMLKRLTSGGDSIQGRLLYQEAFAFKIQAKPIMCVNDMPKVSSPDSLQGLFYVQMPSKFVDASLVTPDSPPNFRPRDDTIKAFIAEPLSRMAFFHLIARHYVARPVRPSGDVARHTADMRADNGDDLMAFTELFQFTGRDSDVLTVADAAEKLKERGVTISAAKIKLRMENGGAVYARARVNGKVERHYRGVRVRGNLARADLAR